MQENNKRFNFIYLAILVLIINNCNNGDNENQNSVDPIINQENQISTPPNIQKDVNRVEKPIQDSYVLEDKIINDKKWVNDILKKSINSDSNLNTKGIKTMIEKIKSGEIKNIIVMTGAGISVNAGIPDFRSKNGLYQYVKRYQEKNLETPIYNNEQEFFEINKFKKYPEHFFKILRTCGKIVDAKPTLTHLFFKLLEQKKILLKYYTQNIDCLEDKVGLTNSKMVRYHGSFSTSTCLECGKKCDKSKLKKYYEQGEVPYCKEVFNNKCSGVLKPDVVFFGQEVNNSPTQKEDFVKCDLLIVIGTSLAVSPFNSLVKNVRSDIPRILINLEKVGDLKNNPRKNDIFLQGDCDKSIAKLIKSLGWDNDLKSLLKINEVNEFILSMRSKFGETYNPNYDPKMIRFYDKLINFKDSIFQDNIVKLLSVYKNYFCYWNNRDDLKLKLRKAIYYKADEYKKISDLEKYIKNMEELCSALPFNCFWDEIYYKLKTRMEKRLSIS
ncbi:MAG: hypothetical protein GY830_08035 [Bacteroidetes bacterium]|nr:hypothetical protein [Bacteroidota bacterium]